MLNLLNSEQTRQADHFTINSRSVTSLGLMESAAVAFVSVFKANYTFLDIPISFYCGTGNNGGDGLAVARLLKEQGYDRLSVKIVRFSSTFTEDFAANLKRLTLTGIQISEIFDGDNFPEEESLILVDALLGSGLNRPLEGSFKKLVEHINQLKKTIVSIDVPSGFPSEGLIDPQSTIIKANLVISFQRPKINFFFPESAPYIDRFRFVDIGLDENFIQSQPGGWKLLESDDVRNIIIPRRAFSHKGTYGHALIIAGSAETMGAALLCADACLHSGAGLTTACIPSEGLNALNARSPEVMALLRKAAGNDEQKYELKKYQAVAIGPGLGKEEEQARLLKYILENAKSSLVVDADALNILSTHPELMRLLSSKTILTPHMKEFDRLFGKHNSCWERIETGRKVAREHDVIILLKNQYSFIILPDGNVVINPTGNPAMAVGGMGDVLTGMIAGLLAQGYEPQEAALAACYLHGKAGDLLNETSMCSSAQTEMNKIDKHMEASLPLKNKLYTNEKSGMNCIPPRYIIKKLPEIMGSYSSAKQVK